MLFSFYSVVSVFIVSFPSNFNFLSQLHCQQGNPCFVSIHRLFTPLFHLSLLYRILVFLRLLFSHWLGEKNWTLWTSKLSRVTSSSASYIIITTVAVCCSFLSLL